jgi:phosphotransferase system IIA component
MSCKKRIFQETVLCLKIFSIGLKLWQKVKQGDVLVIVDLEIIKKADKSLISPVIFTDGRKCQILKSEKNVIIGENDIISLN